MSGITHMDVRGWGPACPRHTTPRHTIPYHIIPYGHGIGIGDERGRSKCGGGISRCSFRRLPSEICCYLTSVCLVFYAWYVRGAVRLVGCWCGGGGRMVAICDDYHYGDGDGMDVAAVAAVSVGWLGYRADRWVGHRETENKSRKPKAESRAPAPLALVVLWYTQPSQSASFFFFFFLSSEFFFFLLCSSCHMGKRGG